MGRWALPPRALATDRRLSSNHFLMVEPRAQRARDSSRQHISWNPANAIKPRPVNAETAAFLPSFPQRSTQLSPFPRADKNFFHSRKKSSSCRLKPFLVWLKPVHSTVVTGRATCPTRTVAGRPHFPSRVTGRTSLSAAAFVTAARIRPEGIAVIPRLPAARPRFVRAPPDGPHCSPSPDTPQLFLLSSLLAPRSSFARPAGLDSKHP